MYIVSYSIIHRILSYALYTLYILHTGQLRFVPGPNGEGSRIDTTSQISSLLSLNKSAELLGVTASDLTSTLTTRILSARMESYTIQLTPIQASDARDALAKAIYSTLFNWLVSSINTSILVDTTLIRAEIGILYSLYLVYICYYYMLLLLYTGVCISYIHNI